MALGCYTPLYLPASFKGVPFDAMDAGSEHGRRGAVGEFPFGENTAYADLGRKARHYSIRARFPTNDHIAQSAALIAVCESTGSGPLVHPTRGIVNVACKSCKIRDNILEEQGITYADMDFVEANDWPGGLSLGGSIAGLAIAAVIAIARETFLSNYSPSSVPAHRRRTLTDDAANIVATVAQEYRVATVGQTTPDVYRSISELETVAGDYLLLNKPATVDTAISLGMNAVAENLSGDAKIQAMRRIANSISGRRLPGKAGTSQNALHSLTRIVAGAFMSRGAIEATYSSASTAFEYYDLVTGILASEARIAYDDCDNNLFLEIRDFTIQSQSAILAKAYKSPALISYSMPSGAHPLVAAYQLFGDAKRHRELELGNALSGIKFKSTIVATSA